MHTADFDVVTGAFGYAGQYIARQLLAQGRPVVTLTGHPGRPNPFGHQVRALPFDFERPELLTQHLRGAHTLYNTYWVRFTHGGVTFAEAVQNTKALFTAAKQAGVRRVVHVSITNPSLTSPLPYFHGKAQLEEFLRAAGLSYAILRPAVVFGDEDILINNIAWLLRRLPVFAIPGAGDYRLQPIFVEDLARLAVELAQRSENAIVDAVGPEAFTFNELVRLLAQTVRSRAWIVHVSPRLTLCISRLIGRLVGDVLLTRDEIDGLMADLLVSNQPPTGTTRLSDWLREHAGSIGQHYASELKRHYGQQRRVRSEPRP